MTTLYPLRKGLDAQNPSLLPQELSRCSIPGARKLLSYSSAQKLGALPLGFVEQYGNAVLTVAVGIGQRGLQGELQFLTGHTVRLVQVPHEIIQEAIFHAYKSDAGHLEASMDKVAQLTYRKRESAIIGLRDVSTPENDLLCSLIDYAIAVEGSDLHLLPRKEGLYVTVRVAGELQTKDTKLCSIDVYERMVQRLKVLSKLDITTKQLAQEGSFIVPLLHGAVTARVSIIPSVFGEAVSIRFINQSRFLSIDELKFSACITELLKQTVYIKHGLVLFSGATGSGKTTSLYALTELLASSGNRVVSIEDPVECIVPWMMQTQVSREKGITFAGGLKALLRQDPDVLMIGEVREAEVARIALEASMTGHLVISSIHAGSAEEALSRFETLTAELKEHIPTLIRYVIHQELRICPSGDRTPVGHVFLRNKPDSVY